MLEDRYEGWLSDHVVKDYENYAFTCFKAFGDQSQQYHPEFDDTLSSLRSRVHSGERLSKSDEINLSKFGDREPFKDSGESLSQFDNEKHPKENLSEFDQKDTKKCVLYYCHSGANFKSLKLRKFKGSELSKEIQSFNNDLAKSDAFEVGYYPLMDASGIKGTWIYKYYDRENMTLSTTRMNRVLCFSRLAICVYNMEEGKVHCLLNGF